MNIVDKNLVDKEMFEERTGINSRTYKSAASELAYSADSRLIISIAELTVKGVDILEISRITKLTTDEIIALRGTQDYLMAEQGIHSYMAKSVANKVATLLGLGLDAIEDVLTSEESTDKDKISAFNSIVKHVKIKDESAEKIDKDTLFLEEQDDDYLNELSAMTSEAGGLDE